MTKEELEKKYLIMKENAETLAKRIDKAIERLQDYDLVEDKQKVINDTFDILRRENE